MLLRNLPKWIATMTVAGLLTAAYCGAAGTTQAEKPPGTQAERPPGAQAEKPPGTQAEKPPGTQAEKPPSQKDGTPPEGWQQHVKEITAIFAALGGAVTVLGAAATTIPNLIESISVRARRKQELLHIESLAELMDKIKKQEVLSVDTLGRVSVQIEAEIAEALDGLQKNREKRQHLKTQDTLRERLWNPAGLTSWQHYFLLYRPHGFFAWLWTICAYVLALLCAIVLLATLIPSDEPTESVSTREGLTTFFVCLLWWWLFRWLAARSHKRWAIASFPPSTAAP